MVPIIHAAATLVHSGPDLVCQVVHYPLFAAVPADGSVAYAIAHQRRTTWVVAPVMLLELVSSVALTMIPHRTEHALAPWVGLGLLSVVWVSTFAVQVPLHARLAKAPDAPSCRLLVVTNFVRTGAWSLRGSVALLLLVPPTPTP
jgi:hypothetical protein